MARRLEIDASAAAVRVVLDRIRRPRAFLKQVGILGESSMQRAFSDQRLGEIKWPRRYPSQKEPFVNVAGIVADLSAGGQPKGRRFDRRPAIVDTGGLRNSVANRVGGDRVVWGSTLDYAAIHNFGLVSTQKLTKEFKKNLAKWLLKKGKPYRPKLVFLLAPGLRALDTEVVQRRFIGITDELELDIRELLESHVSGE